VDGMVGLLKECFNSNHQRDDMAGMTLKADLITIDVPNMEGLLTKFMDKIMFRAIRVFLKACLAKIPVRTGFLRGAFRNLGDAVNAGSTGRGSGDSIDVRYTGKKSQKFDPDEQKFTLRHLFRIKGAKELFLQEEEKFKRGEHLPKERVASHQKKIEFQKRQHEKLNAKNGVGTGKEYYRGSGGKILKTPTSGTQFVTPLSDVLKRKGTKIEFNLQVDIDYFRIMDFYGHLGNGPWMALAAGEKAMMEFLQKNIEKSVRLVSFLGTTKLTFDGSSVTKSVQKSTNFDISGGVNFLEPEVDTTSPQAIAREEKRKAERKKSWEEHKKRIESRRQEENERRREINREKLEAMKNIDLRRKKRGKK
jgi:hypothetical protein